MTKCAFTGHRPQRFPFGFDEEDERCVEIQRRMAELIEALIHGGVKTFYSGMALGVDQWGVKIAQAMRQQHLSVKVVAVLPCETQASRWSPEQRHRYFDVLLPACDDVITLQRHYTADCMMKRNAWLVDHADCLLAVYDGMEKGGTHRTIQYARRMEKPVIAMHPDTLEASLLGGEGNGLQSDGPSNTPAS